MTFLGSLDLLLVCPVLAESSRPELGRGPICGHWWIILLSLALIFFDLLLSAWLFRSLKSWSEQLEQKVRLLLPFLEPSAATGDTAQFVVSGRWIVFDRYPGDPVRTEVPCHRGLHVAHHIYIQQVPGDFMWGNRLLLWQQLIDPWKRCPLTPATSPLRLLPTEPSSLHIREHWLHVRGGASSLMKWICEVSTVSWIWTVSPAPDISTSISQAHVKTGWRSSATCEKDQNPVWILKSSVEMFPSWLCCCLWCLFFFVFTVLVLFNDFLPY